MVHFRLRDMAFGTRRIEAANVQHLICIMEHKNGYLALKRYNLVSSAPLSSRTSATMRAITRCEPSTNLIWSKRGSRWTQFSCTRARRASRLRCFLVHGHGRLSGIALALPRVYKNINASFCLLPL